MVTFRDGTETWRIVWIGPNSYRTVRTDVSKRFRIRNIKKETNSRLRCRQTLELSSPQRNCANNKNPECEIYYLKKHHIIGHQKSVQCTGTEHLPQRTSEMCTVHRNRKFSRRYSTNVYCVQNKNTFQTIHQKYVLCTETEHFPDSTHIAVFTNHKIKLKKETWRFTVISMQLTHNKRHT